MNINRRYVEPCPQRANGAFHDWDAIPGPLPYVGHKKRVIAEYCTFCNVEFRAVVDVPDIMYVRPDRGPYYRNRPRPAA